VTAPGRAELARRPAVLTVLVSFVLVGILALWLVPWDWVPGGHLVPARASALFTPEQIARAERYSWLRRGFGWPAYFLSLAVLGWLALSARGTALVRRVTSARRWWLGVPLGVLAVLLAEEVVTVPFAAASHEVDLRYGLSRQGWGGWSLDQLRSFGVSWVVTTLVVLLLVAVARRSPRWWFAWAGAAALVLGFAGSFLYPVLVEPVFNRFTPMQAGPFKSSILRLADREGVHVDDVLVADASRRTTTLNAYVSGLGSTRRVVVYDNLLTGLTPAEARVVIAHELGHAKHQDVLVGTLLASVGSVGAVALLALLLDDRRVRRRARVSGAADPAVVALVLLLAGLGSFAVSPLQNTVSRAIEARADRTSIEVTHADRTFVRMQRRLALTSLADPTPPTLSQLWWGSHPTVLQRAGLPRSLREAGR
jgi:Zn-dependent protease with chaperone function